MINRNKHRKCFKCQGVGKVEDVICDRCKGYGSVGLRVLQDRQKEKYERAYGIHIISLDDPAELHNTIKNAVGE